MDEIDETIIISLSNPTNATLGTNVVHTLTIQDDDSPPDIDFDLTSSSGDEANASKAITVNLSAISSQGRNCRLCYNWNSNWVRHRLCFSKWNSYY